MKPLSLPHVGNFDIRYLGPLFVVPVFETFRRISYSLPVFAAESLEPLACVAATVAGALIVTLALLAHSFYGKPLSLAAHGRLCLTLAALFGACAALLVAPPSPLPCAPAAALGLFAASGAAASALLVAWVQAYARVGVTYALAYAGLSVFLGCLFRIWLVSNPPAWSMAVVLCGCLVVSSVAVLSLARTSSALTNPESTFNEEGPSLSESIRLGVANSPVTGFALCFFTWGVTAIPPAIYINEHNALVTTIGTAIACVAVLALAYLLRGNSDYDFVRSRTFFFTPVFAVFLAYFSFVRMLAADGMLKHVLSIGSSVGMNGFLALALCITALTCHEKGIQAERLTCPAIGAYLVMYVFGVAAYEFLGNNALYLQIVFSTLYILAIALISTRRATLTDSSRIERTCATLAKREGLSSRELEVLALVARDYSNANIADKLSISPETVRTHKKHIYTKLGVHKQEELLRLVRSER